MWSSRFPCPEGVLSFTVIPTGAKHRVQSPLEGRPRMISMDRPEMESRPYEFLLQCKGLIVICFPSPPFKCRSHYMKHFYTEMSSFLFSSEKSGKTSQRKWHWAASVYTLSNQVESTPKSHSHCAQTGGCSPPYPSQTFSSFNQQHHKAFTCPHLIVQVITDFTPCTRLFLVILHPKGFPSGAVVKNLPANAEDRRDVSSIPGSRRSPQVGNGNPLLCSCLENSMDRGAWQTTVCGVAKGQTQLITHANYMPNTIQIHALSPYPRFPPYSECSIPSHYYNHFPTRISAYRIDLSFTNWLPYYQLIDLSKDLDHLISML